jgi:signal transduction histidine kinase
MYCHAFPTPQYLFFTDSVPSLLYYSHIPSTIIALLIGFFIFFKNRNLLLNRLLFTLTALFGLWTILDLTVWTNVNSDIVIFAWSLFGIIAVGLSTLSIYFTYVFLEQKDISHRTKFFLTVLAVPAILIAPTALNLQGFNLDLCDSSGYEHLGYTLYYSGAGALAIIWTSILFIKKYLRSTSALLKKQIVLMGVGIEFFLITFFTTSFLASFLNLPYTVEQYGFLGMTIFMVFMSILIVQFKVFNTKLIATQALVFALALIVFSTFFVQTLSNIRVILGITLALVLIVGYVLIRSVRREVLQRERLQQLSMKLEQSNLNLEVANDKLKSLDKLKTEFLSLASHQLRSPLTAIKGYSSMLIEESYGKLNDKIDEPIKRIYTSAQGLVNIVEDLLNVSKIEQGGMKYEFMPTDLATIVKNLFNEMQIPAQSKDLKFTLNMPTYDKFMVNADPTKIKQVFLNLTDNSIKYTPQGGAVTVSLTREGETVVFAVTDNGVGISPETRAKLFEKFSRGEGGKMNTGGSGLGLYLAKQIAIAHKGDVIIESEGLGKGSTFKVALPAVGAHVTEGTMPS